MSVNATDASEHTGPGAKVRPSRLAVAALAADIRALLQFHQQLGIASYPRIQGLQGCLPAKGAKGKPTELLKPQPPPCSPPLPEGVQAASTAESSEQLALLRQGIEECRLCSLALDCQGQVVGLGTVGSRLLLIGDYSRQEGEFSPDILFGGAEDAMLWNMMRAIGLAPSEVYVTNAVKCCPHKARRSEGASTTQCLSNLRREIALIRPQIICAMGEVAAHAVLGGNEPVTRLRGRFYPYRYGEENGSQIQVMVTFHPRFLLECQEMKKAAWNDLQMIQRQLQRR